ncbi:diaminopimelate dehydrogenase [Corynebacterium breve]|uniref:Meso-diaminopimelate D-dehydrogenase n=1 Tax=Corynebacterium breve TaxID=3049799 RepID=A0ABY8VLK0_9CORY|nr:diaminopimelate dehydrogenase [Corynebacterium breve]WIM69064.1 diaminopimelate dehydrogenase [Corynebacterium breve]
MRIGIVGYGNLGKSVEKLIDDQPDMEVGAIFSRRATLDTTSRVLPVADFAQYKDEIDVAILCLGSATDIPEQAPEFAKYTPTVDTYDNHRDVPRHREAMDKVARENNTVAVVSTGWDPGMFSINRTMAEALLPGAKQNTFWGPGLSQGHSDAVRRIEGVKAGVQYTIPAEDALDRARKGETEGLDGKSAHKRVCYIVADEADQEQIEQEIRTMPDYFVGYQVEVNFIDEVTFEKEHTGMPHGGHVITTGDTGGFHHMIEYTLELDRNPDFTGAVAIAYARAAVRLQEQAAHGAYTVLEVPPYLISPTPLDELIARDV